MTTYVYKPLPDGGYTALPARSAVEQARLLRQGWSLEPPMAVSEPVQAVTPELSEPSDSEPVAEAPKKRGRKPKAAVN